ncbi:hypothetical protein R6Q59_009362 [Mikania micrantha]
MNQIPTAKATPPTSHLRRPPPPPSHLPPHPPPHLLLHFFPTHDPRYDGDSHSRPPPPPVVAPGVPVGKRMIDGRGWVGADDGLGQVGGLEELDVVRRDPIIFDPVRKYPLEVRSRYWYAPDRESNHKIDDPNNPLIRPLCYLDRESLKLMHLYCVQPKMQRGGRSEITWDGMKDNAVQ